MMTSGNAVPRPGGLTAAVRFSRRYAPARMVASVSAVPRRTELFFLRATQAARAHGQRSRADAEQRILWSVIGSSYSSALLACALSVVASMSPTIAAAQNDFTDWRAVAAKIVERMALVRGERVLLA